MRTSKERKEIEYFNEHVYNEANKILPEDSESTMNAKMMAENKKNKAIKHLWRKTQT